MNCPGHAHLFSMQKWSYRDLPVRYSEPGLLHRREPSGTLHGLLRVRHFIQDDAHIFCAEDQIVDEVNACLEFAFDWYTLFGFEVVAELSTRPENRLGSDEFWDKTEGMLRQVLSDRGLDYRIGEGEGTFYAPKIDVHVKDAIGRQWQLSTLQVDFQLPDRFEMEYTAADGTRARPYMIHRALFGSIERFLGILVEHYAGAFPAWLAPVQVIAVPVSEAQVGYLNDVAATLRAAGVRVEVDDSDDRMQKKIRNAQRQKVPFMLIAGGTDADNGAVSFRYRDGEQRNGIAVEQAVSEIADFVARRVNESPTAAHFG
jgi:threonyl-tRNA synthetase